MIFTIGILLISLLLLNIFCKKQNKSKNLPKEYSIKKIIKDYIYDNNIRKGFSKKKIPDEIDTIIIGSGIGGLTCAGLLSRVGKRVLVLEQHYVAGGCTHTFEDKGYEFDTGVHYIGNISKRKKILDLITEPKIEWDRIGTENNGYMYDKIIVGDKTYELKSGLDKYLKEVEKHFPEELENVKAYLKYLNKVSKEDTFFFLKILKCRPIAYLINKFLNKNFFKYTRESALEVVQRYTKNKDLQSMLLGQFGGYGKNPSEQSFLIHASYANHYMNGAWYPKGGSIKFAENIVSTIRKNGGDVLVRKAVKKIIVENNKALGVEMINGVKIYAKNVVSACGIFNTYKNLLKEQDIPKELLKKVNDLGVSCSLDCAFIGLNKSPKDLDLVSTNIWYNSENDYDEMIKKFEKDPDNNELYLFLGFPCMKDSTWDKRFPNKSTAIVITTSKYSNYEIWKDERPGNRSNEYKKKKEKLLNRILDECLYKYFPKTKGCVEYMDLGTPLTFNNYIKSLRGECYGSDNKQIRYQENDWILPKTVVNNLYLTGQDITTLGVTGAIMGGVLTAHTILGYGTIMDMITGRNLIEDIMYLDKKNK